jgi:histidinol phosphatase-like PHP family hydrolase
MYGTRYVEEYIEYMSIIAAEGPMFSVSTDAHVIHRLAKIEDAWRAAERIGITEDRIWRPESAPMKKPVP